MASSALPTPPPLPPRHSKIPCSEAGSPSQIEIASSAPPTPPPLPPRPITTSETGPSNPNDDGNTNFESGELTAENNATEQQLREQYEAEEIQRFLHLFSNYVMEVRATDIPATEASKSTMTDGGFQERNVDETQLTSEVPSFRELGSQGLAEMIALKYVLPNLPPIQRDVPPFTLGRLRQTSERLYLIVQSTYIPFSTKLLKLSTWEDRNKSLMYCMLYWILWWYNLLLPAVVFRVLCSIFRRKLFPYPTLSELRQRQERIAQAGKFGDQVTARLSSSSTLGAKEVWRLFRLVTQGKKDKTQKNKHKGTSEGVEGIENVPEDITIVEDPGDETSDFKRFGLQLLSDTADFHERVRNLFIWRRPTSSIAYCILLMAVFFITLCTPTKYLVKTVYLILGFLFWHVIPVLSALPPAERLRLPPMLSDIPTDAEYAMEIISRRVAQGLPVSPLKPRKKHNKQSSRNAEFQADVDTLSEYSGSTTDENTVDNAEWKKWSDRINTGRSLAAQGKRLFTGKTDTVASPTLETHTFPAQYNSTPGVIDLTPTSLTFAPLLSKTAKLTIPLASMKGVKKTALLKGLDITWNESTETGEHNQKIEKFIWIGGRDELFARLISVGGRNWMRV